MRVYVHGNCQAPAIAALIREQFPQWHITAYEVFAAKIIDEIAIYYEQVANADIIISQPIHVNYRNREDLSLAWLKQAARPGTKFVVFPSMHFEGQLLSWRSLPLQGYGMDYLDAILLHYVALGMSAQRIVAILLDEELFPEHFISQEIDLSIAEMRRREIIDGIDVPLSPFLQKYGSVIPLFHIINHPCRPALAYITAGILSRLGYQAQIPAAGPEYLPFPHVPVPPSVRRMLRARSAAPPGWDMPDGEMYHLPKMKLTYGDYCMRAVRLFQSHKQNDLISLLEHPNAKPFLQRVSEISPALPGFERWLDRAGRAGQQHLPEDLA